MFPKSSSSITRPQYVCVKVNKDKKQRHINLLPLMSNPSYSPISIPQLDLNKKFLKSPVFLNGAITTPL